MLKSLCHLFFRIEFEETHFISTGNMSPGDGVLSTFSSTTQFRAFHCTCIELQTLPNTPLAFPGFPLHPAYHSVRLMLLKFILLMVTFLEIISIIQGLLLE